MVPDRKYFSLSDAGKRALRGILGPVAGASHKSRNVSRRREKK